MKRRTLQQLRSKRRPEPHHHVYVVLLDPAVGKLRPVRTGNPERDPKKPCVYVGLTGLTPEQRFANHKAGIKDAPLVKRYGIRLLPEFYEHLNPMRSRCSPGDHTQQQAQCFPCGRCAIYVSGIGLAIGTPVPVCVRTSPLWPRHAILLSR